MCHRLAVPSVVLLCRQQGQPGYVVSDGDHTLCTVKRPCSHMFQAVRLLFVPSRHVSGPLPLNMTHLPATTSLLAWTPSNTHGCNCWHTAREHTGCVCVCACVHAHHSSRPPASSVGNPRKPGAWVPHTKQGCVLRSEKSVTVLKEIGVPTLMTGWSRGWRVS